MWDRFNVWRKKIAWNSLVAYVVVFLVLIYAINDTFGIVETPATKEIKLEIIHRTEGAKPDNGRGQHGDQGGGSSTGASSPSSTSSPSSSGGGGSGGNADTGNGSSGSSPSGGGSGGGSQGGGSPAGDPPGLDDTLDNTLGTVCQVTNPVTGICINP